MRWRQSGSVWWLSSSIERALWWAHTHDTWLQGFWNICRDVTVVNVLAERWCKDATYSKPSTDVLQSKTQVPWNRPVAIILRKCSQVQSQLQRPCSALSGSVLLRSFLAWWWRTKHNVGSGKAQLRKRNKQEASTLSLWDCLRDQHRNRHRTRKPFSPSSTVVKDLFILRTSRGPNQRSVYTFWYWYNKHTTRVKTFCGSMDLL